MENSMGFLKKLKTELPHDPAIPLLGVYPDKTVSQADTCTPVLTCAHTRLSWLCLTLRNPRHCSLPGSSVRGIHQKKCKNIGVGCHAFLQGIFLIQGSNPHLLLLLHWQVGSLPLVPQQHYLQQPSHGNNINIHLQLNE